jgi:hypothetical protein
MNVCHPSERDDPALPYRRHKDTLDSEWHFHTELAEQQFRAIRFINPETNEWLCEDCANLESRDVSIKKTRGHLALQ